MRPHASIVLLRIVAVLATIVMVLAAAALLWLAPWPIDALIAVAAAMAWTAWIDKQEQQ